MTRAITTCLTTVAIVASLAACASVQKPGELTQAEQIYQRLQVAGADARLAGEMLRARDAIQAAQQAVEAQEGRDYLGGLAHIALRAAQTAEAVDERDRSRSAADSLQRARLARLGNLTEEQRRQLAEQKRLSSAEIASLQQQNAAVSQQAEAERLRANELAQRADSLRRANEAANEALNAALNQLRTLVVEITNLRETSRGLVISLSDILFDVDKATLKPGAQQNLGRIAAILKQYPDKQIVVEGHTDSDGSDAYNLKLSEDRAATVRTALIGGGVPEASITSRGLGESQPVATNDTREGKQQNRRVEVIVLGAGKLADAVSPAAPPNPPE